MPFAHVTMSGPRSQRELANQSPVRPNPVITSSATNSTPVSRQIAHLLKVALGRREDPAGADHRLAEERGDTFGPGRRDRVPERGRRVPLTLRDVAHERYGGGVRLDAGEARPSDVHAVVRVLARDQEVRSVSPSCQ